MASTEERISFNGEDVPRRERAIAEGLRAQVAMLELIRAQRALGAISRPQSLATEERAVGGEGEAIMWILPDEEESPLVVDVYSYDKPNPVRTAELTDAARVSSYCLYVADDGLSYARLKTFETPDGDWATYDLLLGAAPRALAVEYGNERFLSPASI